MPRKARPRPARERGVVHIQVGHAMAHLVRRPLRTRELAEALGVSLPTAKRIVAALRAGGFGLSSETTGVEVRHSLPRDCLERVPI